MTEFLLQITSGAGPTETRRFVFQLAERLEHLAHESGLEVRDVAVYGDHGAPRSITLHLRGDAVAVYAQHEGTHALIQRGARGKSSRKRWFVAVALHVHDAIDDSRVIVPRDSLVITACRASGPGGQHVNKVSSAVRVQHIPSGLCVRSSARRSQTANLEHAIRRLSTLLEQRNRASLSDAAAERRADHRQLVRGRPVRTYVLTTAGELVERSTS